jgi:hypothetical protein
VRLIAIFQNEAGSPLRDSDARKTSGITARVNDACVVSRLDLQNYSGSLLPHLNEDLYALEIDECDRYKVNHS